MPALKAQELRKLDDEALLERLRELRAELFRLRSSAARGTIRRESGMIRNVRRNIARILTVLNERRREKAGPKRG